MSRATSRTGSGHTTGALIGAIAGVTATAAMTLAAATLFRRLPGSQQYPLPPRELTERVASSAGVEERMDEQSYRAATLASHFGFGAAAGSLYALLFLRRSAPSVAGGIGYGLAVWTVSYFGWVPALRLLRPASEHPPGRTALMIAVHLVWGATLGVVVRGLSRALAPLTAGPVRDR